MSGSGADDGAIGLTRLPQTSVKRRRWRIDDKTCSHHTCGNFLEQERPLCLMDPGPSVRAARGRLVVALPSRVVILRRLMQSMDARG
jgi:hypothetical protein